MSDYGDYLDEVRALKEWATRPVRRAGKHPLVGIHVSLSVEATVWEYTDAELSSLTQPIFEREYTDAELLARMQPSFELDPPERATASSALQNLKYYLSVGPTLPRCGCLLATCTRDARTTVAWEPEHLGFPGRSNLPPEQLCQDCFVSRIMDWHAGQNHAFPLQHRSCR